LPTGKNKVSDWLLICLLVLLSVGVITYGLGYVPQPGSAPFWAVTAFVWSIGVLGFLLPIACLGYAALLLWRVLQGRDSVRNLIRCAGLVMMAVITSPLVEYRARNWIVFEAGLVLFALGRRLAKNARPPF
jgi:hypothetical protein